MSDDEVRVEVTTRPSRAIWAPRILAWAASAIAAPFTCGASLLGIAAFEGLAAQGLRQISDKADEKSVDAMPAVSLELRRQLAQGRRVAKVDVDVDLGREGFGVCRRRFKVIA